MSVTFLGRSAWALISAVIIGCAVHTGDERERGIKLEEKQQRFVPYVPPNLLLTTLVTFVITYLSIDSISENYVDYFSFFTGLLPICLHIGIYYIVLMPLLPFFRRRFSARTCAMLWLLPNYLYITMLGIMKVPTPLLVIPVSMTILRSVIVIWSIGFVLVMGWHLISHLCFRRQLLRESTEITDPAILESWQKELEFAGMTKKRYRLDRSPAAKTPLTIGFFQRSIRVVLPERHYSPEELSLVLRHEIVHIGREDSGTKFFLVFCTAMCWFNPLMWKAMRLSADDLELSCDETVLLEADDAARHKYADLLLRTAGDERGLTTCLSASARALRYRLENILHPRQRWAGGLAIIVVFYVLIMSCGYVAFGYDQISGRNLIFNGQDPSEFSIEKVHRHTSSNRPGFSYRDNCTDEDALTEYLSGLNFCKVTGDHSFPDDNTGVTIWYHTPEGERTLILEHNSLRLVTSGRYTERSNYYCTDKLDWDLLYSLIVPHPHLDISLSSMGHDSHFTYRLSPRAHILRTINGDTILEYPPDKSDSVVGSYSDNPIGRVAMLSFTHALYDGTYEILVENWARTSSYTVSSENMEYPMELELAPYFAHYTVRATIVDDEGVIYDTEYRFDLGPLSEISSPK